MKGSVEMEEISVIEKLLNANLTVHEKIVDKFDDKVFLIDNELERKFIFRYTYLPSVGKMIFKIHSSYHYEYKQRNLVLKEMEKELQNIVRWAK